MRLRTATDNRRSNTRTINAGEGCSICDQQIRCVLRHRNRKFNRYDLVGPTAPGVPCRDGRSSLSAFGIFHTTSAQHRYLARLPHVSTMTDKSKKGDGAILSLDVAISLVNIGKEASSMTPAPAVFGVATILLTTIRVGFIPLRERDAPGSNIVRTRWPMNKIVWISGYCAPMSAMRSGGERAERRQTSSASRCAMR